MPDKHATFVQYVVTRHGYIVTVYDADCQPVEEYRAGNHPLDSFGYVRPAKRYTQDHVRPVRIATLRKWAKQEALDTAKRYGLPPEKVSQDFDGEAYENESRELMNEAQEQKDFVERELTNRLR